MNTQSLNKEIINWNIHTFQNLKSFVDLIHRVETKQQPKPYDYKIRDFYFQPSFHIFGIKNRETFIQHSSEIIQNFLSFNQLGYLQSLSFEHHMQKHKFWNKIYYKSIRDKNDHDIKTQVRSIVWTYRLIPLTIFLIGGISILKMTGVSRMSAKKQIVPLLIAVFISDLFVKARKSSDIFYLIPPIGEEKLENQRLEILNKGLVLDGKINQIQYKPGYVDELIDVADNEENYEEKKKILEAAGFIVIDSQDYQYI